METDKTTLNDLAVFQHDEEYSLFHKLDFTRTVGGREKLREIFSSSLKDIEAIQNVQKTLQLILEKKDDWPLTISNGICNGDYINFMKALLTRFPSSLLFHPPIFIKFFMVRIIHW